MRAGTVMRRTRHSRSSWLVPQSPSAGFLSPAVASGVSALGASAIGAVAFGALAIGALAVRQLTIRRARARVLIIDKLVINRIVVRNIERPARASATTNGTGADAVADRPVASDEICVQCGGAGVIDSQRCDNCDGTGHITKAIGG